MAKRGGFPGGGMPGNMNNLMKQAQKMQQKMATMQEELDSQEFEAVVGGGVVKAIVTGKKELKTVTIDPEAVDPDDVEMLEDLIVAAVNQAIKTADETVNKEMSKLTGGLGLPNGMM
ncbi:YbaB/EbfC family nucleoid-associated protein [Vallitaleaceae bacterium 9-2]